MWFGLRLLGLTLSQQVPVADFTGTPTSGQYPLEVQLVDESDPPATSWHWEKNDGSGWVDLTDAAIQNPVETFDQGTWSVRLTATNAYGSNTKTRTDYITSTP